jgi:hypothetical protein
MLAHIAGGCTATPAAGYYISDGGSLVREAVTVVKAFLELTSEETMTELEMMAYDLGRRLNQKAVLIEMDGQPVLLKPERYVDRLWLPRVSIPRDFSQTTFRRKFLIQPICMRESPCASLHGHLAMLGSSRSSDAAACVFGQKLKRVFCLFAKSWNTNTV